MSGAIDFKARADRANRLAYRVQALAVGGLCFEDSANRMSSM